MPVDADGGSFVVGGLDWMGGWRACWGFAFVVVVVVVVEGGGAGPMKGVWCGVGGFELV